MDLSKLLTSLLKLLFKNLKDRDNAYTSDSSYLSPSGNSNSNHRESEEGDEAGCNYNIPVLYSRIEKVLAEKYPNYTILRNVPIADFDIEQPKNCVKLEVDYVLVDKETENTAAAILTLNGGMYNAIWLENLYAKLDEKGVKHVHFMIPLPNRTTYIRKKLTELFDDKITVF